MNSFTIDVTVACDTGEHEGPKVANKRYRATINLNPDLFLYSRVDKPHAHDVREQFNLIAELVITHIQRQMEKVNKELNDE